GVRLFQFPIQQPQCFIDFACPFTAKGQAEQRQSSGLGRVLGKGVARLSESLRGLASCRQNHPQADLGRPAEEREPLMPSEGCQFRQTLKGCCQRTTQPIDDRSPIQCNSQYIWVCPSR